MVGPRSLVVALALFLITGSGCSPRSTSLSLPPAAAPARPPADVVFVVPLGTYAAEIRGEPSFSMPSRIALIAGQSITVRNDDQAMHYFFDIPVAPGQTFRKTFNQPGAFGYSPGLSCSLAREGGVTVEVAPP